MPFTHTFSPRASAYHPGTWLATQSFLRFPVNCAPLFIFILLWPPFLPFHLSSGFDYNGRKKRHAKEGVGTAAKNPPKSYNYRCKKSSSIENQIRFQGFKFAFYKDSHVRGNRSVSLPLFLPPFPSQKNKFN